MGQQDGVELGRVERERDPVADRLVRAALEHAAVDEDARALGDEQELRAGDGGRAAEEVDLHGRHGDSRRLPRVFFRPMDIATAERSPRHRQTGAGGHRRGQTGTTTSASIATARNSRLR